jgi:hypothetical protein
VVRVSYDGKTVDYRSVAEIDRAIEALDREIASAEMQKVFGHGRRGIRRDELQMPNAWPRPASSLRSAAWELPARKPSPR